MTKKLLTREQWETANRHSIEVFKNTLNPGRGSGVYAPIVYRDLKQLNELFISLQIHVPEWESDPLWKMYILPHKSKIRLDDTDSDGITLARFECLPYADLLGREFAVRDFEERSTVVLQKIAKKQPRGESPLFRMWRVWDKVRPAALSRYPFWLRPHISNNTGWALLRSPDKKVLVSRFYEYQTYEITGCSIRRELYDQEAGRFSQAVNVAESRVRAVFEATGYWTGTLSELVHDKSFYQMVLSGSRIKRNTGDSDN